MPRRSRTAATPTSSSTLVDWGMTPAAVLRAATVVAADLINVTRPRPPRRGLPRRHHRGARRPAADITVTQQVGFVMKGGKVFRMTRDQN